MKEADTGGADLNVALEMNRLEYLASRISGALVRFRRKFIPYMVFYGQEVNVRITWKEDKLQNNLSMDQALGKLNKGRLAEIEKMLSEIGVSFDRGVGFKGRDWEWDWSLRGPVNVGFRSVCKTLEKRK